jgi:predicted MFS family arabinose efflux permease
VTRAARHPAKPWVVIVLSMLAVMVAQAFGRFTYPVLLPAIDAELLGSYALAGGLATLNLTAYLVGTFFVSRSHRFEPTTMVTAGLAASTAGLVVLALAPHAAVVALGLVVTGIAGAVIWLPLPGLAAAAMGPKRRGLAMGFISMGVGLGITGVGQLAAVTRRLGGDPAWRWVWVLEACIGAVVALAAARWLRVRADHAVTGPQVTGLTSLRSVPGWLPLTLAYAGYGLAFTIFTSFLVASLEDDAGFSESHAGAVYAVMGAAVVVGGLVVGRLSDRVGRAVTISGGFVVMAVCILGVLVHAEPWVLLSAFGFGFMFAGLPAPIAAHIADHVDARSFPAAFGTITLFFGMAALIGPQFGGLVADVSGSFTATFVVAAVAAAASAVVATRIPRTRPLLERGGG